MSAYPLIHVVKIEENSLRTGDSHSLCTMDQVCDSQHKTDGAITECETMCVDTKYQCFADPLHLKEIESINQ